MDRSLLHAFNSFLVHHDSVEDPLLAYVNASQLLFGALLLGLLLLGRRAGRRIAIAAATSTGLALLAAQVISRLVDRPRPFVSDPTGVHLFARHAADAGFPSDHATAAFAIAVAVALRWRRAGLVVVVLAGVLAAGRVGLGVHWPTDVLAGAGLGAGAAALLWVPAIRAKLDSLADRISALLERLWAARPRRALEASG